MIKQILQAATLLSFSALSHAVPIVTYDGGTGYATGINGLVLGSGTYDVTFESGSYDDVFSGNSPLFLGDETGADAAADAIMAVLNNELSVPEIALGRSEVLWVAYEEGAQNSFRAEQTGHDMDSDPWIRFADFQGDRGTDYSDIPNSWLFAVFNDPAGVPEPGLLALMSLGLVGFTLTRRRRC